MTVHVRVLMFGGTTEGRLLGEALAAAGVEVLMCVATDYGRELVKPHPELHVRVGRLDAAGIQLLIRQSGDPIIVDATHPYAREATLNIWKACAKAGVEYLRVVRERWDREPGVTCVESAMGAAAVLTKQGGTALLSVGSKELGSFATVPNYAERLYARVLPTCESVGKCTALGFSGRNLICMQGPFSHALNVAMLRDLEVDWLVTKDSGESGGFYQKLTASKETGVKLLLISRPDDKEKGYDWWELRDRLLERFAPLRIAPEKAIQRVPVVPRFPAFLDLKGKNAVVVGGGTVSARRAGTLLRCGAVLTAISPALCPELGCMAEQGKVIWRQSRYTAGDLELAGAVLAVAASNDANVNKQVGEEARALGIPCSVADDKARGSFWFPAFVQGGNLVAGIVSTDGDHKAVRDAAAALGKSWGGKV